MIAQILSDVLIFIGSTVKFALSSSAVVTGNLGISGTVANVLGGITGIVLFTYLGGYMRTWIIKTFPERFDKKFSKGSRFLVKVKRHSGLFGVALMTPIFLSIPVGVMLALDLTSHKRKIVTSMALSCFFWSAVFFIPYYAFSINVLGWFRHKF